MKRKPPADPVQAARKAAQRAALNALRRARRRADKAGVALSEWEDGFLGSVSERVETYGRAFGDPDKGASGQALSALQARKLKEIVGKAKAAEEGRQEQAKPPSPLSRSPFTRSCPRRRGSP